MLTVGHGTLAADELGRLLAGAGVAHLVDVRRFPGSRRHPQVARAALGEWLPAYGVGYRWAEALGGRRPARPGSSNDGLTNASFRAYADHMAEPSFLAEVARLLDDPATSTAVLC